MAFEKTPPTWSAAGSEPPSSLKTSGWQAGQKPAAAYFNWFWYNVCQCLEELYGMTPEDISAAAASHKHAAGDITSGTLPVARGGTGVAANPSMLTNLGSTTAASVFAASPRPGVTGTLSIANGGTGSTTADAAIAALGAAKSDLSNVTDSVFQQKASAAGAAGAPIVTASASDGATFTATVNGLSTLAVGTMVTIIPSMTSTSTTPTLNVNSLGAKQIMRRLSGGTITKPELLYANVLYKDNPVQLMYDGTYWLAISYTKPTAADLYGTVSVDKGGTGATTAAAALQNLGITSGTADLTAGTSELATGAIYLVYEE